MDTQAERAKFWVDNPSESLSTEVKNWIDPGTVDGKVKIVRTLLALRNNDGGQMVIGFDDGTMLPSEGAPTEEWTRQAFSIDCIQALVSKYASEPYEIGVEFVQRESRCHPVIFVPAGVRTPVASRSSLAGTNGMQVVENGVYVRTLRANNTPSTSLASWKDWESIAEKCFENREADVGRFIRRHLNASHLGALRGMLSDAFEGPVGRPTSIESSIQLLDQGESRFSEVMAEQGVDTNGVGFWSAACVVSGALHPFDLNRAFLDLLSQNNPSLNGWPLWSNSRANSPTSQTRVADGNWETVELDGGWGRGIEFSRINPRGEFFLIRSFQDDRGGSNRAPQPGTELDFGMQVLRPTEAIAVCLAFARCIAVDPSKAKATFAFRWRGLKGRKLTSWADGNRSLSVTRTAYQNCVETTLELSVDSPNSIIGSLLVDALKPLYAAFDGFELSGKVIEELSLRTIERRA